MEHEEEAVYEAIPYEEEIGPFDWEDYLYEAWLEEQWEQKRKRPADASL